MSSVNRVIIIGHLGRDPELRFTQGGVPNARLSVATSHSYKDKDGARQEETTWHRVTVWSRSAETCNQYLKKGRQVCVEGRIRTYKYRDKNEQERWGSEIAADRVHFLSGGRRNDDDASPRTFNDQISHPAEEEEAPAHAPSMGAHDDIPF